MIHLRDLSGEYMIYQILKGAIKNPLLAASCPSPIENGGFIQ